MDKVTETPEQMIAQMNILDYLIFANDPSREAIYKINKLARKVNITDWLKDTEPNYFIPDNELDTYLEQ